MTGSQKKCFMAVASLKSYTRAAETLHVSQPAITKQIQTLEAELGILLLERDKRSVQLTENGERFFRLLQQQDIEMNRFLDHARQREGIFGGTVRVGLLLGWDIHHLHDALMQDFNRRNPNIRVRLAVHYFRDLYRMVLSNELDLVVTLQSMLPRDMQIHMRGIGSVPRAILISNNHPLAERADLSLLDLAEESFYLINGGEVNWLHWRNNILGEYDIEPDLVEIVNYPTMLTYLRNGSGVGLVDAFCQKDTSEDFRMMRLNFNDKIILVRKTENLASEITSVEEWISDYFKSNHSMGLPLPE